ncbi:uncharacterized protein [Diadema antillarum]|uniref:uncharacterized protein n=1 Tax=Diadema antillarum TaxID=105358 RepID=UPI003A8831F9
MATQKLATTFVVLLLTGGLSGPRGVDAACPSTWRRNDFSTNNGHGVPPKTVARLSGRSTEQSARLPLRTWCRSILSRNRTSCTTTSGLSVECRATLGCGSD